MASGRRKGKLREPDCEEDAADVADATDVAGRSYWATIPSLYCPRFPTQPHGWPVLVAAIRIDSVLVQRPKPLPVEVRPSLTLPVSSTPSQSSHVTPRQWKISRKLDQPKKEAGAPALFERGVRALLRRLRS